MCLPCKQESADDPLFLAASTIREIKAAWPVYTQPHKHSHPTCSPHPAQDPMELSRSQQALSTPRSPFPTDGRWGFTQRSPLERGGTPPCGEGRVTPGDTRTTVGRAASPPKAQHSPASGSARPRPRPLLPGAEGGRRGRAAARRGRAGPLGAGGEIAVPPAAEKPRRAAGAAAAAAAAAGRV